MRQDTGEIRVIRAHGRLVLDGNGKPLSYEFPGGVADGGGAKVQDA